MLKKFQNGQNQVFIMASQSEGHIYEFQHVEQIETAADLMVGGCTCTDIADFVKLFHIPL